MNHLTFLRPWILIVCLGVSALLSLPYPTTAQDDSPVPIAPTNADSLRLVAVEGVRGFEDVIWQGDQLYISSAVGVFAFAEGDLTAPPQYITGYLPNARTMALSADGQILAVLDQAGEVRLWETENATLRGNLSLSDFAPLTLHFLGDTHQLAIGGRANPIQIWDVDRMAKTDEFGTHEGAVWVMEQGATGRFIASGGGDQTVEIWDSTTRASEVYRGHTGSIFSIAIAPDDRFFASAGADSTLRLWDLEFKRVLYNERLGIEVTALAFTTDNRHLITANDQGGIQMWALTRDERRIDLAEVLTLQNDGARIEGMALSPDESRLAVITATTVQVWDLTTGQPISTWGGEASVNAVAYDPSGAQLAIANGTTITLWDADYTTPQRVLAGHTHPIHHLGFSATGRWLASADQDQTVQLWDMETGEVRHTYALPAPIKAITFSPDGRVLAVALDGNQVYLWKTGSGELSGILYGDYAIEQIAYRGDGELLISTSADGVLQIWRMFNSAVQIRPSEAVYGVVHWQGRAAFVGGADGSLQLWDINTLRSVERERWQAQTAPLTHLALSPAGDIVAALSADHSVALWEIESGQLRGLYPTSAATQVMFHPAGHTLLILDALGNVWRYGILP